MAHREEDTPQRQVPDTITVQLSDAEPFAGLVAAVARFCSQIGQPVYDSLSADATETLATIQGIMWRLEHSRPEMPMGGE